MTPERDYCGGCRYFAQPEPGADGACFAAPPRNASILSLFGTIRPPVNPDDPACLQYDLPRGASYDDARKLMEIAMTGRVSEKWGPFK